MSRWVQAKAVRMANAETIIRYLEEEEVFPYWGYPEALLTDRRKLLTGHKWKYMCYRPHTQARTIVNYHPRVNLTKQRNGEIKKGLHIQLLQQSFSCSALVLTLSAARCQSRSCWAGTYRVWVTACIAEDPAN